MVYEIDAEFLSSYEKIRGTLYNNYTRVSDSVGIKALNKELNEIVYEAYKTINPDINTGTSENTADSIMDLQARIDACVNEPDFKVFEFIIFAGLSSYYGLSNLDCVYKENNEFGYKDCFIALKKLCRVMKKNASEMTQASLERLLSTERECSCAEYFNNKKYLEDIQLMSQLLSRKMRISCDEGTKQAIMDEFSSNLSGESNLIVETYKSLLSASFGLSKYKGVFTFDKAEPVVGLDSGYRRKVISPSDKFYRQYQPILSSFFNAWTPVTGVSGEKYSDRQFDFATIYKAYKIDADKPVYFPHKVLELVSLAGWAGTNVNVYRPCSANDGKDVNKNLTNYTDYLRSQFDSCLFDFCVYCCKCEYSHLPDDIKRQYDLEAVLEDDNWGDRRKFTITIADMLRYFTKCVTTSVILVSVETEKKEQRGIKVENIIDFRIKLSHLGDVISNEEFCRQLSERIYHNVSTMSDIEISEVDTNSIGISITDYSYTFDADKVYARPIFAYKALQALQDQGQTPEWKNMLLGKYADGSICRSANGEKINLLDKRLHNIYAGSRSGKGVMCFNIFATAIASEVPIFYCDRKPDTAVILKALAPNMFAVNGGQYSSTIDLQNKFNPSGIHYRIPSYLESALSGEGVKDDLIYFRAMLLLFSLVIFVDKVRNKNDARYLKIVNLLSNGAVFVFDEFTNFVEKFLSSKPTTQGWFQNCYSELEIKSWGTKLSDIRSKKADLDAKQSAEKRNEAQIIKAEGQLETAMSNAKDYKLDMVYFAEFADDYIEIVKTIPELFRAAGDFVKQMQIFIIGQNIPSAYYESNEEFTKSNGASKKKYNSSTHPVGKSGTKPDIPLICMLNKIGGDYIFGYQPPAIGDPRYLAQTVKGTISSSMLTQSRRCFCYNKGGSLTYAQCEKITNTEVAFGNNTEGMKNYLANDFVYFKPFLILNNANVPPAELLQTDEPNLGVSNLLETKRKGEKEFSQYKDSQYVGQCLTSCNKAGLTWEDLLNDNKDENGCLHTGVGFEGYIKQLCGSVPVDSMSKSGDVMSILVNEVFGYKDGTWMDFLADFRPEALFKATDFVDAIDNPDKYGVQYRLRNSFFLPELQKVSGGISFATVFAQELGTLAQYYEGGSYSDTEASGTPDNIDGVDYVESDDDFSSELTDANGADQIDPPDRQASASQPVSQSQTQPNARDVINDITNIIGESFEAENEQQSTQELMPAVVFRAQLESAIRATIQDIINRKGYGDRYSPYDIEAKVAFYTDWSMEKLKGQGVYR